MAKNTPLLLVDGSSYLFRAYHALPDLSNGAGFPTGAVRGVIAMLRKLAKDFEGSPIAVVFDAKGKTFRNEIFGDYKANRPPMPNDLQQQIEPIHRIIKAMGFPLLVEEGVEADDVIGTLAKEATVLALPTVISTSDKDMAQLVSESVSLVNTMTEVTLDRQGVIEKFGVPPERIVDYLALMGDSVDNIPGVPKVGPKTAVKWLNQYRDLEGVISHADDIKGKVGENLRNSLEQLPVSHLLATIKCDVKLSVDVKGLKKQPANEKELKGLFEELEFKTWLDEISHEAERPTAVSEINYGLVSKIEELDDWISEINNSRQVAVSFITEDKKSNNLEISGVALASKPGRACYVPLEHKTSADQIGTTDLFQRLGAVLSNKGIEKVFENLKDVHSISKGNHWDLNGPVHSTMLQSYVVDSVSTRGHRYSELAKKYLEVPVISEESIVGKGAKRVPFSSLEPEELSDFAAQNADILLQLHEYFFSTLTSSPKLLSIYQEIELPTSSVLARIERAGAQVDARLLLEQSRELADEMDVLQSRAYKLADEEFNLASPKQLQVILFEKLCLPVLKKTGKGQPSTAEPVLQELATDYGEELPRVILEYRSLSKLKSTYTDALPLQIDPETGRIHTTYNQAVTATGRLSSTDPNLQNIPIRTSEGRRIRKAFTSSQGQKIVAADYSQIELRIMAHLSEDLGLTKAFSEGLDVHKSTAADIFDCELDEVTADQRRSAKAINFGLIYGMSAFGLGRQLGIARNLASDYMDRYFQRYPAVHEFMEETRLRAHKDGFVETIYGRRLYLPDINARNKQRQQGSERQAVNAPMQGSAADIIKRAMVEVDAWLQNSSYSARMIMQVHDELVFEVVEAEVDAVIDEIKARMESAAVLKVPLVVDVGIGDNWDEAH